MGNSITYMDVISLAVGLIGATLGILNSWYAFDQRRVQLKVIPKIAIEYEQNPGVYMTGIYDDEFAAELEAASAKRKWCIEVVNLSAFPVTICAVGFGKSKPGFRSIIFQPEMPPNQEWPTRLGARQAAYYYTAEGEGLPRSVATYPQAFAETDCEHIAYGTTPVLTTGSN